MEEGLKFKILVLDPDHAPFGRILSRLRWDLHRSIRVPNLKFLALPIPPELPSFDEPGLSSDGAPSLFVVQTFGTLFPQLSAPQTLTLLSGVR